MADAVAMQIKFALWLPGRMRAIVWEPPGGWDVTWTDVEKYAAVLAYETALRQGFSEADAGTMAVMSVNLRVMKGLQYSEIWMRRLAAARLIG